MKETLTWSLGLARRQTLRMVDDLREEQWCLQSSEGEHHPAWIIGHLLLADCYLLHLLGVETLPTDFGDLLEVYGPGATPKGKTSGYLPYRVAVQRLERTGTLRCDAVSQLTSEDLGREMPDADLSKAQPTIAYHLQALVFHEGHHGGQLAAWRHRGSPSCQMNCMLIYQECSNWCYITF